jgi:hypothetical protein
MYRIYGELDKSLAMSPPQVREQRGREGERERERERERAYLWKRGYRAYRERALIESLTRALLCLRLR